MRTPTRRPLLLPLLTLALLAGATACGGGDEPDGTADGGDGASTETTAQSAADAALAFAQCMRDEGIADYPDPEITDAGVRVTPGDVDPDDPAVQAARAACDELLQQGTQTDATDEQQAAELQEQLLEFAQCMRERGIDFPDPRVNDSGGVLMNPGAGVDAASPEFADALAACQGGLPTGGGTP